jgi:hypothetical protein
VWTCRLAAAAAESYYPDWLLGYRRRAEQALVYVVATAYLREC